jgi:hypothetical protein
LGSIFLTALVGQLIQFVFNVEPNFSLVYLLLALGMLAWFIFTTLRAWFWEFRIEEDQLYLKKLSGEIVTIQRDTIQNVDWQNNKVFFYGFGKSLTFRTNNLSIHSKAALSLILFYWAPQKSLPLPLRGPMRETERLGSQPIPLLQEPILVQMMIWGWSLKFIKISNEGMRYKTWLGEKFFSWDKIQAVAVMSRNKQFKIWINNRYSRISLRGFKPVDSSLVSETILAQLQTRKIPVGYSEMRF